VRYIPPRSVISAAPPPLPPTLPGGDRREGCGVDAAAAPFVAEGVVLDAVFAGGTIFQVLGHAGGVGPGGNELVEQGFLLGTGGSGLELGQHPGHAARLGSGLLQLAHVARATHGGQGFERFGDFDLLSELGVEGAGGQTEFAHGGS